MKVIKTTLSSSEGREVKEAAARLSISMAAFLRMVTQGRA